MAMTDDDIENQKIEIQLLIEALYRKYGYDFRDYSPAHVRRRILHRFAMSGLASISAMQHEILNNKAFLGELLHDLSINITEMFRDPPFFLAVRQKVVPLLQTYPFIKIWHAGCSTGEEIYSMAILLKEEGLLCRSQLYATDINTTVLEQAKSGIVPINNIKQYTVNYQKAGGTCSFADYYNARYDSAKLDDSLLEKIVFADHNLVTDGVFGEMNMIICRNVMIYFNKNLQNRVYKLFLESLCNGGFLCIGAKENIQFSKYAASFEDVAKKERIYRKKYTVEQTHTI